MYQSLSPDLPLALTVGCYVLAVKILEKHLVHLFFSVAKCGRVFAKHSSCKQQTMT